jgi:hypothetical protein
MTSNTPDLVRIRKVKEMQFALSGRFEIIELQKHGVSGSLAAELIIQAMTEAAVTLLFSAQLEMGVTPDASLLLKAVERQAADRRSVRVGTMPRWSPATACAGTPRPRASAGTSCRAAFGATCWAGGLRDEP